MRGLARVIALVTLPMTLPAAGQADPVPLPPPQGPVILTVAGAPDLANDGDLAVFDIAMIEALGVETMITLTPWTRGPQTFEGVPVRRLAERLGLARGVMVLHAINDYSAEVEFDIDTDDDGALIAHRLNGKLLPMRGKGPFWLVFPFDSDPALQTETVFARSVWQIDRIDIRPMAIAEDP